jgi:hypothetical protein
MSDPVNELVEVARQSEPMVKAIERAQKKITDAVLELDDQLAKLQAEPHDVGESIKRAFVLRGTVDNLVNQAFAVKMEREA